MKRAETDVSWRDVPAAERVDYLIVVASIVAADEVAAGEIAPLEELCQELGVDGAARDRVLAMARQPERDVVEASLARLRGDVGLRVRLMTDAIVIAFADGRVSPQESEIVARLGEALEIAPAQIGLIARYVEEAIMGHVDEHALSRALDDGLVIARPHSPGVVRRMFERFRGRGAS